MRMFLQVSSRHPMDASWPWSPRQARDDSPWPVRRWCLRRSVGSGRTAVALQRDPEAPTWISQKTCVTSTEGGAWAAMVDSTAGFVGWWVGGLVVGCCLTPI